MSVHTAGERKVMTPEISEELDRLISEGLSGMRIARRLGLSPTTVYRRHRFAKSKPRPIPPLNGDEQRVLLALMRKLEAFLLTPNGVAQSAVVRPQVEALRRILE